MHGAFMKSQSVSDFGNSKPFTLKGKKLKYIKGSVYDLYALGLTYEIFFINTRLCKSHNQTRNTALSISHIKTFLESDYEV